MTQKQQAQAPAPEHLQPPHPIPEGQHGGVCPITGLSPHQGLGAQDIAANEARAALEADPDIAAERLDLVRTKLFGEYKLTSEGKPGEKAEPSRLKFVPLNVIGRTHHATSDTARLVRSIGGLPALRRFTSLFYQRCFKDPHIDRFLHSHEDPHGERFATWVAEKFGDGTPWSNARKTRAPTYLRVGREVVEVAFDRSSAHFAAWNSPKREAHKLGQHFKLDDARVWMRLHFWAARDAGLFEHEEFMEYYTKFIGHFIRVYSSTAPAFTRESARWSEDPANIDRYRASGNVMSDALNQPFGEALASLPMEERSGSWPYDLHR